MKSHLVSFGNYLLNRYNVQVHSTDGTNEALYSRQVSDADLANWEHENPDLDGGGIPFKAPTEYPSRYEIGEKVKLFLMPEGEETFPGINAKIIAVHFTNSKVKYDLEINFAGEYTTRLYNIDSILVQDRDCVPPKDEAKTEVPIHKLSDVLQELKYGRPAAGQELIDKWIAEVEYLSNTHI